MANSPADNARAILITAAVDNGNLLKIGTLPASPNAVVAISDAPGQGSNPKWLLDYPAIQVLVRGEVNDYNGAFTKAKNIKDALLGIDSLTIAGDRWDSVTMRGDINYIGPDDNSRPVFSLNFGLIIEPATNALTKREALPL